MMIVTLDTEHFPHDRPKRILRMRVILLFRNRFPARQTAEHQDACIRSLDRWKSVRYFHTNVLLMLPLRSIDRDALAFRTVGSPGFAHTSWYGMDRMNSS